MSLGWTHITKKLFIDKCRPRWRWRAAPTAPRSRAPAWPLHRHPTRVSAPSPQHTFAAAASVSRQTECAITYGLARVTTPLPPPPTSPVVPRRSWAEKPGETEDGGERGETEDVGKRGDRRSWGEGWRQTRDGYGEMGEGRTRACSCGKQRSFRVLGEGEGCVVVPRCLRRLRVYAVGR